MTLRPRKMLARYPNANPERQLFSRGYANELQLVRRRLHGAMAAAAPFSTSWRSSHLCSRPPSSAQQDRVPFTTLVGSTSGQPSDRPALNHIRVRGCARSAPTIKTSQWSHKTTFVLAHGYKSMVPPAGPVAARFLILIIQSPGVREAVSLPQHNYIINSGCTGLGTTGGIWDLDHDDGSALYDDFSNFPVYAGTKNYLGDTKRIRSNVIVQVRSLTRYSTLACRLDPPCRYSSILRSLMLRTAARRRPELDALRPPRVCNGPGPPGAFKRP